MIKTITGAQRYNRRAEKIFARYKEHERTRLLLEACKKALLALNTYDPVDAENYAMEARIELRVAIANAEGIKASEAHRSLMEYKAEV